MFGYHDSNRCIFDLWSPVDDPHGCAVENRAFSPYAKHEEEKNKIVERVMAEAALMEEEERKTLFISTDDYFTQKELEDLINGRSF